MAKEFNKKYVLDLENTVLGDFGYELMEDGNFRFIYTN